jgi:hypothetical protein
VTPNFAQRSSNNLVGVSGRWKVGSPGSEPYLIGRFTGARESDKWFRWTLDKKTRVLVPNILPNDQHVTIVVAPAGASRVKLAWNDEVVFDGELKPGWNEIGFTLYAPFVGEHELSIESELAVHDAKTPPVGVAINAVVLRVVK